MNNQFSELIPDSLSHLLKTIDSNLLKSLEQKELSFLAALSTLSKRNSYLEQRLSEYQDESRSALEAAQSRFDKMRERYETAEIEETLIINDSLRRERDILRDESDKMMSKKATMLELLQCKLCLDTVNIPATLTQCGHIYCADCMKYWQIADEIFIEGNYDAYPAEGDSCICRVCSLKTGLLNDFGYNLWIGQVKELLES